MIINNQKNIGLVFEAAVAYLSRVGNCDKNNTTVYNLLLWKNTFLSSVCVCVCVLGALWTAWEDCK